MFGAKFVSFSFGGFFVYQEIAKKKRIFSYEMEFTKRVKIEATSKVWQFYFSFFFLEFIARKKTETVIK